MHKDSIKLTLLPMDGVCGSLCLVNSKRRWDEMVSLNGIFVPATNCSFFLLGSVLYAVSSSSQVVKFKQVVEVNE